MLNIIVPVRHEADNIARLYQEITSKVRTPHQIVIVYDTDEDSTLPVARALQQRDSRLVLVKNLYGSGVLNAIKSGFQSVSHGSCLVVMGDLSDDLSIVDAMVERHRQGYKVVCGSRYMKGGQQIGGPLLKRTLSRWAGLSLHALTGLPTHDVTNSFKLYDKALLDQLVLESQGGFDIGMEITVKAFKQGHSICELPATWRDRTAGESRFRMWRWLPYYLRWYLYALM